MAAERARIGTVEELQKRGCLPGKVGSQPVCVFYSDGQAYAVDDRCPHMGFPLHRGTVENGLLTCHWHHARFDLASGGTLDPFADDVRAHDVEIDGDDVVVVLRPVTDAAAHHLRRLEEGLEQGLTLVTAKAVLGLIEVLGPAEGATAALRAGVAFGIANRAAGWGAGLTVLTAMANVLPSLDPDDLGLALVHGLAFVSARHPGSAATLPPHPSRPSRAGRTSGDLVPPLRRHPERRRHRARPRHGCRLGDGPVRRRRPHGGRRHRPSLRGRRPHHRLHQQGLRSAGPSRVGPGRVGAHVPGPPDRRRVPVGGVRGVAPSLRPAPAARQGSG